jgi:release factor glutamine methyltransferase
MNNNYFNWPQWIQHELLKRLNINDWSQLNQLKNFKNKYWEWFLQQANKNIPLTKILGIKYFYDYKLINKNVLDPRYDSETIFDIFEYWKNINYIPKKVIELGGGSGCLSISITKQFNNTITISELDPLVISTLKRNLKINNIIGEIIISNWWSNIKDSFDVLITNPPYLSLKDMNQWCYNNLNQDPIMALYGGIDGLDDYKIILKDCKKYIKDWIILEICSKKLKNIIKIIEKNNLLIEKIFYDIQNRPRMILIKVFKNS